MKSEVTSQVLSRLLDSQRYDSRPRPNYAGKSKRRHTLVDIYKLSQAKAMQWVCNRIGPRAIKN